MVVFLVLPPHSRREKWAGQTMTTLAKSQLNIININMENMGAAWLRLHLTLFPHAYLDHLKNKNFKQKKLWTGPLHMSLQTALAL